MNRCCLLVACICCVAPTTLASQTYFVSDRGGGGIVRLQDLNGDGDALDIGEHLPWADGFTLIIELQSYAGAIYAVEEGLANGSNQIIRLQDTNHDGDALDVGERTIWADGLTNPRGITGDLQGNFYVADITDHEVWKLTDLNGDGDALDLGEKTLYADNIAGATTPMALPGQVLVTAFSGDAVHRLVDLNGDGDALDIGENTIIAAAIDQPLGLLSDGSNGFFFSSRADDTVYHAKDLNGDGDFLDLAEVLGYADAVYGGINGSWDMAPHDGGGFLLADYLDGEVLLVHDLTGDNDALDLGEVTLFADGFSLPVDIATLSFLAADFDEDGDVDGEDLAKWEIGYGTASGAVHMDGDADHDHDVDGVDFLIWQQQFGSGTTPLAASTAVPEPSSAGLLISITFMAMFNRCGVSYRQFRKDER